MVFSTTLLLLVGTMLPPPVQTTYVVDGSGGTPGAFTSITGALAGAGSGDIVQVKGMVDPVSNLPVGYSENNFFGGIGETFPISVPSGVTIAGISGPVYVYSQNASPPAAIFDLSTGSAQTRIGNLGVLGGGYWNQGSWWECRCSPSKNHLLQ